MKIWVLVLVFASFGAKGATHIEMPNREVCEKAAQAFLHEQAAGAYCLNRETGDVIRQRYKN